MMKVVVLDDTERVASRMADWSNLDVEFLLEHLEGPALSSAIGKSESIVLMRERTRVNAELLDALPQLRLIVTTGTGNAAIDLAACRDRGITVCGTRSGGAAAAELTWALILCASRHIVEAVDTMRSGGWARQVGGDLEGRTLGVLGLGSIGRRVARYAQAFDMEVLAWSPNLTEERCKAVGVRLAPLAELLGEADIVTVHLALGEQTVGIIGARELAAMKESAWLVNTSRGPIIDEVALLATLEARAIAGACVDVYVVEPLAVDHPLRRMANVLVTPHIGYVTEGSYQRWYQDAAEALRAFAAGRPIRVLCP